MEFERLTAMWYMRSSDIAVNDRQVDNADLHQRNDWDFSRGGLSYLQAIMHGELVAPASWELLRLKLVEAKRGRVSYACVPDESMSSAARAVHNSIVCAMLDAAASSALVSVLPGGKSLSWLQAKVSYIKTVDYPCPSLAITGTVLECRDPFGSTEARLTTASGAVVAIASSTFLISKGNQH